MPGGELRVTGFRGFTAMQPSNLSWTVLLFGLVLIAAAHAIAPSARVSWPKLAAGPPEPEGRVGPSPAPAAVPAEFDGVSR